MGNCNGDWSLNCEGEGPCNCAGDPRNEYEKGESAGDGEGEGEEIGEGESINPAVARVVRFLHNERL